MKTNIVIYGALTICFLAGAILGVSWRALEIFKKRSLHTTAWLYYALMMGSEFGLIAAYISLIRLGELSGRIEIIGGTSVISGIAVASFLILKLLPRQTKSTEK